jgi:hypothetical protein
MTITPTSLIRSAAVAAIAAGLLFIGVQIKHPHLDADTITTTEMAVRNSLKVLMTALALVGITGMYLRQVRQVGLLGLVGYVVFGAAYLLIMSTTFAAAFVLPTIAGSDPAYVEDVLAAGSVGTAVGDIGALHTVFQLQGAAFLAGGLLFGIAMYRARVLARWACALLAVGGLVTAALALMPDAFYRLLAFPNAIAMIGLGYSLWTTVRRDVTAEPVAVRAPHVTTAGAE